MYAEKGLETCGWKVSFKESSSTKVVLRGGPSGACDVGSE